MSAETALRPRKDRMQAFDDLPPCGELHRLWGVRALRLSPHQLARVRRGARLIADCELSHVRVTPNGLMVNVGGRAFDPLEG